jgi:transcriptional regulator with XRE-family HTH domain
LIEVQEELDMTNTNVANVINDLRQKNPDFDLATAEIELVRKVGDTLQKMREEAGLTQEALAKRLGISASRVSQLESGTLRDAPNLKTLARFAHECGQKIEFGYGAASPAGLYDVVAMGFVKIAEQIAQAAPKWGTPAQVSAGGGITVGANDLIINAGTIDALTMDVAHATYCTLKAAGMKIAGANDVHVYVKGTGIQDGAKMINSGNDLQMTVTVPFVR